jgi:hypothetical protein
MHRLIENYWREWFPRLPSYQTFVLRLNRLEPTFQTLARCCLALWPQPERQKLTTLLTPCP